MGIGSSGVVALRLALAATILVSRGEAQIVAEARTHTIAPQAKAPDWFDWSRVNRGLAFHSAHCQPIDRVLGTTSLVSTYAAIDIAPVLMQTGRLAHDYNQRIRETGQWIGEALISRPSREDFLRLNYRRATELGRFHLGIARSITVQQLGWNPSQCVTMNQQAYALVLYSFAWQPIEALIAMHAIDPAGHPEGLEHWFHLWSVLGYAMGVEPELLPRSYEQASLIEPKLRAAQYASSAAARPAGIPVLLKGELNMLIAADPRAKSLTPEKAMQLEADALAQAIGTSPGLGQALGLDGGNGQALLALVLQ